MPLIQILENFTSSDFKARQYDLFLFEPLKALFIVPNESFKRISFISLDFKVFKEISTQFMVAVLSYHLKLTALDFKVILSMSQ